MRKKPNDEAFRPSFEFSRRSWDQRLSDFNRFSQQKHGVVIPVSYYIPMFWGILKKWNIRFAQKFLIWTELILLNYIKKTKTPNKTYFHETLLSDCGFVKWIVWFVSKKKAQGKLCKCDISLSNMGEKLLRSHITEKKHKKCLLEYCYLVYFDYKMTFLVVNQVSKYFEIAILKDLK